MLKCVLTSDCYLMPALWRQPVLDNLMLSSGCAGIISLQCVLG